MRVSLAGSAAASSDDAIAVVRQVFQRKAALGIIHKRARRDFDSQVLGATALLVGAAAGSAARGAPKAMMGQRGQIVHAIFGDDDHTAAVAAVAAVGSAVRNVFFAPKAHAAVAAAASLNFNGDAIDEHLDGADIPLCNNKHKGRPHRGERPSRLFAHSLPLVEKRRHTDGACYLILPGIDIDSPAFLVEADHTIDQCEQSKILAHAHVGAGTELGAALTDDDVARNDSLAAEPLHAAALGVRVPTVASRALTLLMCHLRSSLLTPIARS